MQLEQNTRHPPRPGSRLLAIPAAAMLVAGGAAAGDNVTGGSSHRDFATEATRRLDQGVHGGVLENLHAVVVVRSGEVVVERYYEGRDERWGQALGNVRFDTDTLHDLRSVSKSVVGILYGIALDESKVPALDAHLLDHLPEYPDPDADMRRRQITVEHALTMRLGLEWNEHLPYTDARNSEHAMEMAPDRCRYVLEQPVITDPGTRWAYSGGATALLARLITRGTGVPLEEYARLKLFDPMGIDKVEWVMGSDSVAAAASGLRMRPLDLARIGRLILNGGRHDGRQLVPAHWIKASLEPRVRANEELYYGYHWWIAPQWSWAAAFGNGGQRLTVFPGHGLVVAVAAGNYNQTDDWKVPVTVLVEAILPALEKQAAGD